MSKRRSKRPSPGSQLGKPSGSNPFNTSPFIDSPSVVPNRRGVLRPKETTVDPVLQMPGVMGKPPSRNPVNDPRIIRRGKGFIPFSGGPKVKKGDRVGPPEDIIRKVNRPKTVDGDPNSQTIIPTVSPRKKGEGQPRPRRRVRGDYSNPMDFVKPSDFLTPAIGQPQKLPPPNEGFGPTDEPYGPIDTRPKPKAKPKPKPRVMKPVPDVPPVPLPPEIDEYQDAGDPVGVYYFDKGRFLTRGKYNGKTSRTTQRRG